jgi:hypothetical protein
MTEEGASTYWRKCGSCKKEINYSSIYQVCNVSTCKKLVFCSVDCWNLHNPVMNHKSSWAEENRAPKKPTNEDLDPSVAPSGRRIIVQSRPAHADLGPPEVLIVASKLKQYVKDKHDMNTAGNVMDALTLRVRYLADRACEKAKAEGRKTLMDRDFD